MPTDQDTTVTSLDQSHISKTVEIQSSPAESGITVDIEAARAASVVDIPTQNQAAHNRQKHTQQFNRMGYYHAFFGGKERIMRMVPTAMAATSLADAVPLQPEFMERGAFQNQYKHLPAVPSGINPETQKPSYQRPADIWLTSENRNLHTGLCFNPEDEPLTVNRFGQFNLYQGQAVIPADCSRHDSVVYLKPFLDHIMINLCHRDEPTFWAFISVMAAKYQNPTIKPFATIIHGIEGTGKDTVIEPFMRLYGAHGKKAQKAGQVIGEYNAGTLSNCTFLWMDEAFAGTKDATDCMKTVVFSDRLRLNDKYVPPWEERSLNQTVLSTNREGMIRFATHDRRYFVLKMSEDRAKDTPENKAYFDEIWSLINSSPFLGHLANYLLKVDVSQFNFRRPPVTKNMALQKLATCEPEEKFTFQMIRDGGFRPLLVDEIPEGESPVLSWPKKIHAETLNQAFKNWLRDTRTPFARDEAIALARILKKVGFEKKPSMKINGINKKGWILPTLDDAKEKMVKILGADIKEDL